MKAKRRGDSPCDGSPWVAQAKVGVRPTPVIASRSTLSVSLPLVTSASATLRVLRVPLGINGSLPSGRLASAAKATENPAGVPPRGEYNAVPSTLCSPLSEVDFHQALLS